MLPPPQNPCEPNALGSGVFRRLRKGGGLGLFVFFACAVFRLTLFGQAEDADRRPIVLILHSYNASSWSDGLNQGILEGLKEAPIKDYFIDYMGSRNAETPEFMAALGQLYLIKFDKFNPRLIIACDDNAYKFAVNHHGLIWNNAPVVFCGVGELKPGELKNASNVTGITEPTDLDAFAEALLRVMPNLRHLQVVRDNSPYSKLMSPHLEKALGKHLREVRVEIIEPQTLEGLRAAINKPEEGCAVFLLSFWRDYLRRPVTRDEMTALIKECPNPVFTSHGVYVGRGAAGASVVDGYRHGLEAGRVALRVLKGTPLGSIPPSVIDQRLQLYDWSVLSRHGLQVSGIPADATVINRPVSIFEQHRLTVIAGIAIISLLCLLVVLLIVNILRRRLAVRSLADSERRLHAIFDQTFEYTWLLDPDGRIVTLNNTLLRQSASTHEQLRGRHIWETPGWGTDPAETRRLTEAVRRVGKGAFVRLEIHCLTPDGRVLDVDVSVKSILNEGGDAEYLLVEGRDITGIRRMEEQLHTVLERAPIILWSVDTQGAYTLSVGSGLERLGQAPNQMVGQNLFRQEPGDERLMNAVRTALAGEQANCLSLAGGRYFETRCITQKDAKGRVLGVIGVSLDVTERMEAQAMQTRLATAVEQAAEQILLTDKEGLILYVNPAFEKVTGYSREEVQGRSLRILKSGSHDEAFYRALWSTLREGKVWSGRFQNRRKNGDLYLSDATITPLIGLKTEIEGYVAVTRDVTEQVSMEESLRQSQRTETIGKLAGGIAHDFNNILQVITTSVAFARDAQVQPSELEEHLTQIAEASARATSLTRQLLAFSRRQALSMVLCDPKAVVADVVRLIRRILGEQVQVVVTPCEENLRVKGDTGQLEQVLVNLCVNARDAMPEGGTLTISVTSLTVGPAELPPQSHDLHPGAYVELSVCDTGTGMTEETARRIFEPFFTTKPVGKGTGLGLSVVQGIVQQHGGFVVLDTCIGKGTTFRVRLPRVEATEDAAPPESGRTAAAEPAEKPTAQRELILLADDDTGVRQIACRILTKYGYQVLEASDGEEACQLATQHAGRVRLAILDMVMPRLGGVEAAKRLQRTHPELRILICSGYASESLGTGTLDGPWRSIQKPYAVNELLRTVRESLEIPPPSLS